MKFTVTWSEAKKFEDGNFKGVDFDGVYLIGYRNLKDDKRYPVYVGQGAIKRRLEDHLADNACVQRRIRDGGAGYYRYARCASEDDRLDIELGLYRNHGGDKLCNENEPPDSGRYPEIVVEEKFA